jgi:hypothetical protein
MAKQIESIEIFPGENGGHRVVHNFKREAGKKEGSMAGGIYMEKPKAEEHFFGTSEDSKVSPSECREHGGRGLLMAATQDKSAINRMLSHTAWGGWRTGPA